MNIDKKQLKIAKSYANAIIEIAKGKNRLDEFYKELNLINEILKNSTDLKVFLENPVINISDKKEVIQNVLKKDFSKEIVNFLNLLLDKNRFNIFETIFYCYQSATEEIKNISRVEIISAIELNDNSKKNLIEKLEKKLNKKILAQYEIKEEIIGGLIVKIQDKTIDLSLNTKFKDLEKQII